MRGLALLVLLFCLGAASCAAVRSSPDVTFETVAARAWRMVAIGESDASASAEPLELRFELHQPRVSGYAGVNRFSGAYERTDASLRFGPLAATRRAGPPELMDLETRVLGALGDVRGWRATADELVLLDEGGAVRVRCEPLTR